MEEDDAVEIADGLADAEALKEISAIAMRCGVCGAKVGTDVLSRALRMLEPVKRPDVLIGLNEPDDAAVVEVPAGKVMVHTVDFFRAFVDDPYIFGQVAANHALGDVFAMGAEPQSALAVASVPFGPEAKVEETLFHMMSGAMQVLADAGASLVGGHTSEASRTGAWFFNQWPRRQGQNPAQGRNETGAPADPHQAARYRDAFRRRHARGCERSVD